jgi:hypothetical protein
VSSLGATLSVSVRAKKHLEYCGCLNFVYLVDAKLCLSAASQKAYLRFFIVVRCHQGLPTLVPLFCGLEYFDLALGMHECIESSILLSSLCLLFAFIC